MCSEQALHSHVHCVWFVEVAFLSQEMLRKIEVKSRNMHGPSGVRLLVETNISRRRLTSLLAAPLTGFASLNQNQIYIKVKSRSPEWVVVSWRLQCTTQTPTRRIPSVAAKVPSKKSMIKAIWFLIRQEKTIREDSMLAFGDTCTGDSGLHFSKLALHYLLHATQSDDAKYPHILRRIFVLVDNGNFWFAPVSAREDIQLEFSWESAGLCTTSEDGDSKQKGAFYQNWDSSEYGIQYYYLAGGHFVEGWTFENLRPKSAKLIEERMGAEETWACWAKPEQSLSKACTCLNR